MYFFSDLLHAFIFEGRGSRSYGEGKRIVVRLKRLMFSAVVS